MPFGLTNSPAMFQSLDNDVLRDMLKKFLFVYFDDILIFDAMKDEHVPPSSPVPLGEQAFCEDTKI